MPNNRHRQNEKLKKAELVRARREFKAKGYNFDKTVETLSIIENKVVEAISITMQQFTEGMYNAAVAFGNTIEEANKAYNEAMINIKEQQEQNNMEELENE